MGPAIQAIELERRYGKTLALRGLSFEVARREVVGFLGPNGAGKSTTMKILTGYIAACSGEAVVDGVSATENPAALRSRIGYLPEALAFYDDLRVHEYLGYRARLKGVSARERRRETEAVIDRCGLAHMRRRLVGQLSKGYRQRVGLADALIGSPPVLILDEPTVGLDPHSIRELRGLIRELADEHAVLLSSHILPEVEQVCQRVLIVNAGRIVAAGPPQELVGLLPGANRIHVELAGASPEAAATELDGMAGVERCELSSADAGRGFCALRVMGAADATSLRERIAARAAERGWRLRELRLDPPTLEDLFVEMTADELNTLGSAPDSAADAEPSPEAEPPLDATVLATAVPLAADDAPLGPPTTGHIDRAAAEGGASTEERDDALFAGVVEPSEPPAAARADDTALQVGWRSFRTQLVRELGSYLMSPQGWVVTTIFCLLTAATFLLFLNVTDFNISQTTQQFFNFVFYWFVMLFLPPILTMRTLAEERRAGRLQPLLTAPVSTPAIVLAKYGGALLFFAMLWMITLSYFLVLDRIGIQHDARVEWGPLAAGYLGTLSLGAALIAIGLLASALTKDPLVAAVLGVVLILMGFLIGFTLYAIPDPELRRRLLVLSWIDQIRDFSRGVLDSRHLIYNGAIAGGLLAITTRLVQLERWR